MWQVQSGNVIGNVRKEERYEKELERAEARHNKAAFDSPYVANAYYGTQLEDKSPLYRRVISLVPRRHHGSQ